MNRWFKPLACLASAAAFAATGFSQDQKEVDPDRGAIGAHQRLSHSDELERLRDLELLPADQADVWLRQSDAPSPEQRLVREDVARVVARLEVGDIAHLEAQQDVERRTEQLYAFRLQDDTVDRLRDSRNPDHLAAVTEFERRREEIRDELGRGKIEIEAAHARMTESYHTMLMRVDRVLLIVDSVPPDAVKETKPAFLGTHWTLIGPQGVDVGFGENLIRVTKEGYVPFEGRVVTQKSPVVHEVTLDKLGPPSPSAGEPAPSHPVEE